MRKIKKISVIFLSVLLIAALMSSVSVGAATYVQDEKYRFRMEEDGSFFLDGYFIDDPTLVIPDEVATHIVTGITPNAFADDDFIEHIVFGKNLTTIGAMAFAGSTALKDLTLPESMTALVWGAFQNCTALTDVVVSESAVAAIPEYCFYGCTALKNVTLNDNITTIERFAFANCTSLEKIVIPSGVTSIDETSFKNCDKLVFYCYPDSYALEFAAKNGFDYTVIGAADKTALNEAISSVQAILSDTRGYTPETLEALQQLYNGALALADDSFASQEQVDSAAKELSAAVSDAVRYEMGDVDMDGIVSIKDASQMQLYKANLTKFNDFQLSLFDINGDGEIDIRDAAYIQLKLARLLK